MYTRATSTIFVITVVAATTLLLLASTTITGSVFAAKASLSHHSGKSNGKTSSSGSGSTISSGSTTDSTNNNTPSTISNGNPNFDNLLACESTAAHGSGQLTKAEVMNCYLQFSRGSASSLSIIGNGNNSPGNTGSSSGATSGSTSTTHHAGLSTTHTHSHHHSPTNPISSRGNSTSSG
jgi:hypothetical protein